MPTLEGSFQHVVYSPRGGIEGVLLHVDGVPSQIVFDKHDDVAPLAFEGLEQGQVVRLVADLQGPSSKGGGDHAVHAFARLVSVDGAKPAKRKATRGAAYQGTVVRLNYARHGAANGVVLDSGDFIHVKPDGMAKLKLKVGDAVRADGDAQLLATGKGWAVEASKVNGKSLGPR